MLPKQITIEMLYHCAMWLNTFPARNGISTKFLPCEIVTRQSLDFTKHCHMPFGSYCEVHNEPTPLNGMRLCTHPTIALGPTGNAQGTYKFFCLEKGTVLNSDHWTEYPTPDSVIWKGNRWGAKAMQPEDKFTFANCHCNPYPWNKKVDSQLKLTDPKPSKFPAMAAEIPGVDLDRDQPTTAIKEDDDTTDNNHAKNAPAAADTDVD